MITGRQVRAARAFLGWDAEELAEKAGLSRDTVFNIEKGTTQARRASLEQLARVFEDHGVEFLPEEGVRRKIETVTTMRGPGDLKLFMDQVYQEALKQHSLDGTKPIYICNLDNSLFRKYLKEFYAVHTERLRKIEGLQIYSLAAEVDVNHSKAAHYLVYKYLKELKAVATPFYVFGDKFALIDFDVDEAPTILLIQSAPLAKSYRNQFDVMWKNASDSNKEKYYA
ncbi:MAG: helix-turn-helix transcriptional regulator [Alphaproteobacteria bacterium]|nr:helix-turn-helix transcriptional regulator [Alphaproteobacteria bacterium]